MGVEIVGLDRALNVRLPMGIEVGISKLALEADLIVNVPRLNAHCCKELSLPSNRYAQDRAR